MPLIKPRTRGKHITRHIARLDRENTDTLHAYAAFLGESTDYVLNQVIDTVLAKDKDFAKWRMAHPQSFVPQGAARVRGTRGGAGRRRLPAPPSRTELATSSLVS